MLSTSSTAAAAEIPQTARHPSPGRPFRPGSSGNPAGRRTKPVDVGALCRRHARAAVRALVAALASPDAQASVAAARTLIEHGHGTAVQHHALLVPKISVVCSTDRTLRTRYRAELNNGVAEANMRVAASLFALATKEKSVAACIWWTKARMGWKEATDLNVGGNSSMSVIITTGVPQPDAPKPFTIEYDASEDGT